MANGVGWFEIGGEDFDALTSFYGDLFGWQLKDASSSEVKYATVDAQNGSIGGGLYGGEAKGPMIYIGVDDTDAALEQVKARGGEVVTPTTVVPGMVTFAQFKDPFGNVIGLYKNGGPA